MKKEVFLLVAVSCALCAQDVEKVGANIVECGKAASPLFGEMSWRTRRRGLN